MSRRIALCGLLTALAGCSVPGPADTEAALEVVYDANGAPAFAGQAVMIRSCGGGGFCHREEIPGVDQLPDANERLAERFGAPRGLGFDLTLASNGAELGLDQADRLLAHQNRVLGTADWIWYQVSNGTMPPETAEPAARFEEYRQTLEEDPGTRFVRVAADGSVRGPLEEIETPEGREILRNWLVSGAPVIERTFGRVDREPNVVGFTAPSCELTCVDATWPSIHQRILRGTCALSSCHDSSTPPAGLDVCRGRTGADLASDERASCPSVDDLEPPAVADELAAAYARLLRDDSRMGSNCNNDMTAPRLITPGSPADSLLFLKVSASSSDEVCGGRMPASGNPLSEQRLCALQAWIECGAREIGDDVACLEDERTVTSGGETLGEIARAVRVSIEELGRLNSITDPRADTAVPAGTMLRALSWRRACNIPAGGAPNGECLVTAPCSNRLP